MMNERQLRSAVQLGLAFIILTVCATAQAARNNAPAVLNCDGTSAAPTCWHKLDAGPFSILAPSGWEFHQLMGIDSYVGEFMGDGVALTFDFGRYSTELREAKTPAYVITKEPIGGLSAKLVSPRSPGKGVTGVYFGKIPGHDELCIWGTGLTAVQQKLVLKMFETIRFGGPMPPGIIPPPPPA